MGSSGKAGRTRAGLLEAALDAFADLGFDACTMDDIACRAGVAHGTVYRYFGNKEAVLYALVAEQVAVMAETAAEGLAESTEEGVVRAIRGFLYGIASNRPLSRIWLELTASRSSAAELRRRLRVPFIEAIEAHVRRAQLEGTLPIAIDVEVAARALGAMVDNFAQVWFVLEDRPGDDEELDRLAANLATLWNGALGVSRSTRPEVGYHLRMATGGP